MAHIINEISLGAIHSLRNHLGSEGGGNLFDDNRLHKSGGREGGI